MQAKKMKLKVVERPPTNRPTGLHRAHHQAQGGGCDLVVMGTIVRDRIVPYATARKIGWTDVTSSAGRDLRPVRGRRPGRRHGGLLRQGLTDMPYRDTLSPAAQAWFDKYKDSYKAEPNIGAVYGHVAADLTVTALEKAGPNLTLDSFVKAMESVKGYHESSMGPR